MGLSLPSFDESWIGSTCEASWTAGGTSVRFAVATGSGTLDMVGDVPGGDTVFDLGGEMRIDIRGRIAYDASNRSQRWSEERERSESHARLDMPL